MVAHAFGEKSLRAVEGQVSCIYARMDFLHARWLRTRVDASRLEAQRALKRVASASDRYGAVSATLPVHSRVTIRSQHDACTLVRASGYFVNGGMAELADDLSILNILRSIAAQCAAVCTFRPGAGWAACLAPRAAPSCWTAGRRRGRLQHQSSCL